MASSRRKMEEFSTPSHFFNVSSHINVVVVAIAAVVVLTHVFSIVSVKSL